MCILIATLAITSGCDTKSSAKKPSPDENAAENLGPHPLRFSQLSIRTEKYLLPAVSTGPLDPDWSPDGQWIVFSMRDDIWKVPAKGGKAIALTQGPAYYFEPDWSSDGKSIAFTVDQGEGYNIGIISANGENERQVVTNADINIEPEWGVTGITSILSRIAIKD